MTTTDPGNAITTSQELGLLLCRTFDLDPANVTHLDLHLHMGEPAQLTVTYIGRVRDKENRLVAVGDVLSKYKLEYMWETP